MQSMLIKIEFPDIQGYDFPCFNLIAEISSGPKGRKEEPHSSHKGCLRESLLTSQGASPRSSV